MKAKGRMKNAKWKTVALGGVFDIARGGSPRPIDKFITDDSDGVNWIMISDASSKYITSTKKRIIKEGVKKSREVHPGDFLLTNSMSFGRPYIMQTSGCIHDGWLVLSPRDGAAHPDYFYHLLGSDVLYAEFERRAAGATVKNLNIDLVKGVEVPLPPLEEQKRIAEVLDKAEELRAKRRAALAQLDTLTQAIFLDMFGDPAQNPKGWPLSFVGQHARIAGGFIFKSSDFHDVGVPIIRISDLGDDWVDVSRAARIPVEKLGKGSRYAVVAGDILISMSGSIGKVAVVPDSLPGTAYQNQRVGRYVLKGDHRIISDYLLAFVRSHYHQGKVAELSTGVAQKNISGSQLESISMPLPPVNVQRQYASLMAETQVSLGSQRKSLDGMNQFFDSLQHRAFSGAL